MTRLQARTMLRQLIDEPNASPGKWTDANLNDLLLQAHSFVYSLIASIDNEAFIRQSFFAYPANTWSVDISLAASLNNSFMSLYLVGSTPSLALPSPSNLLTPWVLADGVQVVNYQTGQWNPGSATMTSRYYGLIDTFLIPIPTCTTSTNVHVWFTEDPETLLAADVDNVFGGTRVKYPWAHMAVPVYAAKMALAKPSDRARASYIEALWADQEKHLTNRFMQRTTQEPRFTRELASGIPLRPF